MARLCDCCLTETVLAFRVLLFVAAIGTRQWRLMKFLTGETFAMATAPAATARLSCANATKVTPADFASEWCVV